MLYLVYVLTFLAGILFYALSPRDDQTSLDAYKAEGFIVSFLAQHQAAKDYVTQWLGLDLKNKNAISYNLSEDDDKFISFFPKGMNPRDDISENQSVESKTQITDTYDNNEDAFRYITSVFCLDENDNAVTCNNSTVENTYLVTYNMNRPSWWPKAESNRQRRYGSWRNALTRRTSGSYNCGVLTCGKFWDKENSVCRSGIGAADVKGYWCVDNGKTVKLATGQCAQKVPLAISSALGCETSGLCNDAFFCISKVKQGPKRYYVSGLTAFYDGINNRNTGAEGERGTSVWYDMIRPNSDPAKPSQYDAIGVNIGDGLLASKDGVIFPEFNIIDNSANLFRNFTLTVLLKGDGMDNDLDIKMSPYDNNKGSPGNLSLYLSKESGNQAEVGFQVDGVSIGTTGLIPINIDNQIIALTIIGTPTQLAVYVNAGSNVIARLEKSTWDAIPSELEKRVSMRDCYGFGIMSNTNNAYIYGVRYYRNKALSVKRKRTPTGYTPSELEQNFKVDSKRYFIGSHEDLRPNF